LILWRYVLFATLYGDFNQNAGGASNMCDLMTQQGKINTEQPDIMQEYFYTIQV